MRYADGRRRAGGEAGADFRAAVRVTTGQECEMPRELSTVPAEYRSAVAAALDRAAGNRPELVATLRNAAEEERTAAAFLIAHMPDVDLQSLPADLLVENTRLACEARTEAPWGKDIPEEIFLDAVLPYASVNERRQRWREDFFKRFAPVAWRCATPGEAAKGLNAHIYKELGVTYHATNRPRPHQSPSESIEAGHASCTGLSILLIDACRAAGVPARLTGTPMWTDRSGNHNWVEVWDGQWGFLDAAKPGELNDTEFVPRACRADPTRWQHRIYAVSYRKTAAHFPLVWDLGVRWVSAVDVTDRYLARE